MMLAIMTWLVFGCLLGFSCIKLFGGVYFLLLGNLREATRACQHSLLPITLAAICLILNLSVF